MSIMSTVTKLALTAVFLASSTNQASAAPMFCQEGVPMTTVTGFYPSASDPTLSCVAGTGACVDKSKCPQLSPPYCPKGVVRAVVTGFSKLSADSNLSCPRTSLACVDSSLCPSAGQILCQPGSHAVYVVLGFYPNPVDPSNPNLKCPDEQARCVDDSLGCPRP